MFLLFAWRYFRARKSTNAINIISWITTAVIAFSTMCQVLVLSVFNGFEGLVRSLYSDFYTDLRIIPKAGKTILLNTQQLKQVAQTPGVKNICRVAEEKALIQNGDQQTVVALKGVDSNYPLVTGIVKKIQNGKYDVGNTDNPLLVLGSGIENALGTEADKSLAALTVFLPKKTDTHDADPESSITEGNAFSSGSFAIQQDFDNKYVITNIGFVKQQMKYAEDEYSAVEIKLDQQSNLLKMQRQLQLMLGNNYLIQTRYQQNSTLYSSMELEKWAVFAILTLILIIASFNMVSALTMLVLEKQKDIAVLKSMGAGNDLILKIFISEGMILAVTGSIIGVSMALIISYLQLKFKLIKLQGTSFLIDYFPIKFQAGDFVFVIFTAFFIALIASWFPARKAAATKFTLRN